MKCRKRSFVFFEIVKTDKKYVFLTMSRINQSVANNRSVPLLFSGLMLV